MPGAVEQALATMTDEEGVYLPEDIYTAVLRDQSGEFFRDWPAATAAERRTLLAGLTGSLAAGPERPLVMRRVIVLVLLESDPLLWQTALEACRTARDAEVRRFAAAALGHESAEVRRRACEYFRAYPAPDAIAWLQATMNDETNFVAAAAARALPLCGRPESLDDLASLLNRPDADCRLASGTALAQFGDERGRAALERLAYDPDPAIRI